jgi:hypothetical protein
MNLHRNVFWSFGSSRAGRSAGRPQRLASANGRRTSGCPDLGMKVPWVWRTGPLGPGAALAGHRSAWSDAWSSSAAVD